MGYLLWVMATMIMLVTIAILSANYFPGPRLSLEGVHFSGSPIFEPRLSTSTLIINAVSSAVASASFAIAVFRVARAFSSSTAQHGEENALASTSSTVLGAHIKAVPADEEAVGTPTVHVDDDISLVLKAGRRNHGCGISLLLLWCAAPAVLIMLSLSLSACPYIFNPFKDVQPIPHQPVPSFLGRHSGSVSKGVQVGLHVSSLVNVVNIDISSSLNIYTVLYCAVCLVAFVIYTIALFRKGGRADTTPPVHHGVLQFTMVTSSGRASGSGGGHGGAGSDDDVGQLDEGMYPLLFIPVQY
jgi:hypothetical protein